MKPTHPRKPTWLLVMLLGSASAAWSQSSLGAAQELTLNPPWSAPVSLEFPQPGPYRLEAATLAGAPLEVVVERQGPGGVWNPVATNRTLKGNIEAVVEWSVEEGSRWRVRPATTVRQTVVLRMKRAAFASLRDTLKQDLSVGPAVSLPLILRLELPQGTGGLGLAAASGARGELWVGWLVAQGTGAEVWSSATGKRVGDPLVAAQGPWTTLNLGGTQNPAVVAWGSGEAEARAWTGLDWVVEAAPATGTFTSAQGTFRYESSPLPRVWRTDEGWVDLELPRNRMLDKLLLGSTSDGLYALLASSSGREREFYSWAPGKGWKALLPPPAEAPPRPHLWSATNGAGTLFVAEGQGTGLVLRSFDGTAWRVLDLSGLAQKGLKSVLLTPPSPWSKTGTLVVATDRLTVYDLP